MPRCLFGRFILGFMQMLDSEKASASAPARAARKTFRRRVSGRPSATRQGIAAGHRIARL